jgi:hypothetical protein
MDQRAMKFYHRHFFLQNGLFAFMSIAAQSDDRAMLAVQAKAAPTFVNRIV